MSLVEILQIAIYDNKNCNEIKSVSGRGKVIERKSLDHFRRIIKRRYKGDIWVNLTYKDFKI